MMKKTFVLSIVLFNLSAYAENLKPSLLTKPTLNSKEISKKRMLKIIPSTGYISTTNNSEIKISVEGLMLDESVHVSIINLGWKGVDVWYGKPAVIDTIDLEKGLPAEQHIPDGAYNFITDKGGTGIIKIDNTPPVVEIISKSNNQIKANVYDPVVNGVSSGVSYDDTKIYQENGYKIIVTHISNGDGIPDKGLKGTLISKIIEDNPEPAINIEKPIKNASSFNNKKSQENNYKPKIDFTPSIDINGGIAMTPEDQMKLSTDVSLNIDRSIRLSPEIRFRIKRYLGKSKAEIETSDIEYKDIFTAKYKNINNKYSFLIYNYYAGEKSKCVYIFDKNNICVGYCFLEGYKIKPEIKNEPELVKIRSLNKNSKYLKEELEIPKDKITFYEKSNGNYIERYALGTDLYDFSETFELDAFYPKELEKNMSKRIADVLNTNYKYQKERLEKLRFNKNHDEETNDYTDEKKKVNDEDLIDFDRDE